MILVENILKKYNAIGINIPIFMIKWMRSNHAGETGAVWIYKGASCIFWNTKISKMSKEHILTETNHLIVMENLLTSNEKSKLILPSFGKYTGGLSINNKIFKPYLKSGFNAYICNEKNVYKFSSSDLKKC